MIMTKPPTPPAGTGISARRIETLQEMIAGLRIDAAATGIVDDELEAMLQAAPGLFEAERRDGQLTFLAFDEAGMAIGVATALLSPLGLELAAASTLPRSPRPRRVPSSGARPMARGRPSRYARPSRPGRRELETDPGTARLPHGRHTARNHRPGHRVTFHRQREREAKEYWESLTDEQEIWALRKIGYFKIGQPYRS
jgi:hypothetical protein